MGADRRRRPGRRREIAGQLAPDRVAVGEIAGFDVQDGIAHDPLAALRLDVEGLHPAELVEGAGGAVPCGRGPRQLGHQCAVARVDDVVEHQRDLVFGLRCLALSLSLALVPAPHVLDDIGEMPFAPVVEKQIERRNAVGKLPSVAGPGGNSLQRIARRNSCDVGRKIRLRQAGIERDQFIVIIELDADQRSENRNTLDLLAEFYHPGSGQRHGLDAEAPEIALLVIDLRRASVTASRGWQRRGRGCAWRHFPGRGSSAGFPLSANVFEAGRSALSASKARRPRSSVTCIARTWKPRAAADVRRSPAPASSFASPSSLSLP